FEAGRQIDWAFARGPIQTDGGQVHRRVHASDHYPLSFNLIQPRILRCHRAADDAISVVIDRQLAKTLSEWRHRSRNPCPSSSRSFFESITWRDFSAGPVWHGSCIKGPVDDGTATGFYVDDNARSRRLLSGVLTECGF